MWTWANWPKSYVCWVSTHFTKITWRGLSAKQEKPLAEFSCPGCFSVDYINWWCAMIQMPALVPVDSFYPDIEHCVCLNFNTCMLFNPLCQYFFVFGFYFLPCRAEWFIFSQPFNFADFLWIVFKPFIAKMFVEQSNQVLVAGAKPTARCNSIRNLKTFRATFH